jgi:hypothetical protein
MHAHVRVPVSVLRQRDAWRYGAMTWLGLNAAAIAVVSMLAPAYAFVAFGLMFGTGGVLVWGPLLFAWARWKSLDAQPMLRLADASPDGLFVDGKVALPRSMIRAAYVSPSWPTGAYLRVERRLGLSTELWVSDVESGHALVRALSLDAQTVTANIGGSSLVTRWWFVLLQVLAISASIAFGQRWEAPALVPLTVLLCVIASAVPTRFVVGTDGVLVSWFGIRQGFVPLDSIRQVEALPGLVRLHLHDGSSRDLTLARWVGLGVEAVGLRVSMLAERIRDAMRRAGTLTVDTTALEHRGDDVRGFVESLRAMSKGAGYRAALQREDLVYVLGDARQAPRVRVAAAIALGELGGEEKTKLRLAADSSSLPEVREAFEAILESDEENLLERMRTL